MSSENTYKKLSSVANDVQTSSRQNDRVRTTRFVIPTTEGERHAINVIRDEAAFPENRIKVTIDPFVDADVEFEDMMELQASCFMPQQAEQLAMNLLRKLINDPKFDRENLSEFGDEQSNTNATV